MPKLNNMTEYLAEKLLSEQGANFGSISPSLMSGRMGLALTYLLVGKYKNNRFLDIGYGLLESCVSDVAAGRLKGDTFCDGLAGIGYGLHLLSREGLIDREDSVLGLKDFFLGSFETSMESRVSDFLHGGFGVMHYLCNCEQELAEGDIHRLLRALKAQSITSGRGLRIHNSIMKEQAPGEFNLSLSHGLAGQLTILSEIADRFAIAEVDDMLSSGISYIASCELPQHPSRPSIFPGAIIDNIGLLDEQNQYFYSQRLGWCYGDLNQAVCYLSLADRPALGKLREKGIKIALSTIHRDTLHSAHVKDPFFCHGSCGLAYIYRRLHVHTKNQRFAEAANHWDLATADLMSGLVIDRDNAFSILEGVPGVILTELAREFPKSNTWDELFLLHRLSGHD